MATRLDVVDQIMNGRLARRVGQLRGEGLSFESIAARLRTEFDVPTTSASVRRWWTALEAAEPTPLPRRRPRQAS